ncbi:MAG: hypothetical protein QXM56_05010 [Acidilobaceae archaeon]
MIGLTQELYSKSLEVALTVSFRSSFLKNHNSLPWAFVILTIARTLTISFMLSAFHVRGTIAISVFPAPIDVVVEPLANTTC